jgi:hypothetical protein
MRSMSTLRSPRALLAALLVLLGLPAIASAHGDAASHYLETSSLYPSFAKQPSQAVELQLLGLLDAAKASGYPLKVALVADSSDVIDMPEMLGKPQAYAEFLERQLEGVRVAVDAPILVIAPSGVGIAGPHADGVLEGLGAPTGATGDELAALAQTAVRQVAAAGGHALPANVPPAKVPVIAPTSAPGSGYDLGGLAPIAVFAAVFGSAVALYEGRTRLARRRRGRMTPTGEAI